jgi:hypothetical protein
MEGTFTVHGPDLDHAGWKMMSSGWGNISCPCPPSRRAASSQTGAILGGREAASAFVRINILTALLYAHTTPFA